MSLFCPIISLIISLVLASYKKDIFCHKTKSFQSFVSSFFFLFSFHLWFRRSPLTHTTVFSQKTDHFVSKVMLRKKVRSTDPLSMLAKLSKLYGRFYKAKFRKFVLTFTKRFKKNRNSKEFCNIEVLKNSQKFYKYKSGFIRQKTKNRASLSFCTIKHSIF